jgi:integrase
VEDSPRIRLRVRGRIESVLAAGYMLAGIDKGNPVMARPSGALVLGKVPAAQNFAAMPYKDVPAFVAQLRRPTVQARALEFLILTAARAVEVRGMTWDEVDFKRKSGPFRPAA